MSSSPVASPPEPTGLGLNLGDSSFVGAAWFVENVGERDSRARVDRLPRDLLAHATRRAGDEDALALYAGHSDPSHPWIESTMCPTSSLVRP